MNKWGRWLLFHCLIYEQEFGLIPNFSLLTIGGGSDLHYLVDSVGSRYPIYYALPTGPLFVLVNTSPFNFRGTLNYLTSIMNGNIMSIVSRSVSLLKAISGHEKNQSQELHMLAPVNKLTRKPSTFDSLVILEKKLVYYLSSWLDIGGWHESTLTVTCALQH